MNRRPSPRAMREAPPLDPTVAKAPIKARYALLINPFYPKDPHASFGKHVLTPSLALTSVAGATPPDWDARYWDENLLQGPPPADPTPHVVGLTVHLTFARRAIALADWFRARGSLVVMGGLHVLSCPDELRPHADALVFGEGTQLWPEALHDAAAGALKKEYHGSWRTPPYATQPGPRRDVLDRRSFLTTASLIATRGCHNRCEFCYLATKGLTMPYQMLEPEHVASQMMNENQPYGVFLDNNLGSKPEYLRDVCRALRPLEKIWSSAVSIDVADDPSLIRDMALSGCTGVFVGFESLNDANIQGAGKKSPKTADYARRVRIFHDNGIQVNGSFVLGFDHDGPDVFERTVRWIEDVKMECATFHIMTPYPGTPLFRQMEREGRLLHRDWEKYDTGHCVFRPRLMSPEALEAGYEWCYRTTFSARSIWARRPEDWQAVAPYLAMSYLYKKSNWLWPWLIRHRLVGPVWRPLVEMSRQRQIKFRRRLEQRPVSDGAKNRAGAKADQPGMVVSGGV